MKKLILFLLICCVATASFEIKIKPRKLNPDEILDKQIEMLFEKFDLDKNNLLDRKEIKNFVKTVTPQ